MRPRSNAIVDGDLFPRPFEVCQTLVKVNGTENNELASLRFRFNKIRLDIEDIVGTGWQYFSADLFKTADGDRVFLGIIMGPIDIENGKWKDIEHILHALLSEQFGKGEMHICFLKASDSDIAAIKPVINTVKLLEPADICGGLPMSKAWQSLKASQLYCNTDDDSDISRRPSEIAYTSMLAKHTEGKVLQELGRAFDENVRLTKQ